MRIIINFITSILIVHAFWFRESRAYLPSPVSMISRVCDHVFALDFTWKKFWLNVRSIRYDFSEKIADQNRANLWFIYLKNRKEK